MSNERLASEVGLQTQAFFEKAGEISNECRVVLECGTQPTLFIIRNDVRNENLIDPRMCETLNVVIPIGTYSVFDVELPEQLEN